MPCRRLEGTNFIINFVASRYAGNWTTALCDFVMDPKNRWCPAWILQNYEVMNNVLHGFKRLSLPPASLEVGSGPQPERGGPSRFPHAARFPTTFRFERGGEPDDPTLDEKEEPNPYLTTDDHWKIDQRPSWQRHSASGPNINAEEKAIHFSPLEWNVNPFEFDYSV